MNTLVALQIRVDGPSIGDDVISCSWRLVDADAVENVDGSPGDGDVGDVEHSDGAQD